MTLIFLPSRSRVNVSIVIMIADYYVFTKYISSILITILRPIGHRLTYYNLNINVYDAIT